jgi:hypothetical protein
MSWLRCVRLINSIKREAARLLAPMGTSSRPMRKAMLRRQRWRMPEAEVVKAVMKGAVTKAEAKEGVMVKEEAR